MEEGVVCEIGPGQIILKKGAFTATVKYDHYPAYIKGLVTSLARNHEDLT